MKLFKVLSLLVFATIIAGCDDSDDGDGGQSSGSQSANVNRNAPAYAGLQFPKVKGGKSDVITHSTSAFGDTYSLEWDHQLKAQRWTCYYFTKSNKVKNWSRNQWDGASWEGKTWSGDPFQLDPKIPYKEQPSVTGEFSGSSYPDKGFTYFQRGHICASEDRMASKEANGQTFYMSNMFPQGDKFNGKLWSKMESFIRLLRKSAKGIRKSNMRTFLHLLFDQGDQCHQHEEDHRVGPQKIPHGVDAAAPQGLAGVHHIFKHHKGKQRPEGEAVKVKRFMVAEAWGVIRRAALAIMPMPMYTHRGKTT